MLIVRTQAGVCLSPARRRKACIQCEDHHIGRSLLDGSTSSGGSGESVIVGLYQRPGVAPILTVEEERLQHCASARRDLYHGYPKPSTTCRRWRRQIAYCSPPTTADRQSCG